MLIYCIVITAIVAFLTGFILGYFSSGFHSGNKAVCFPVKYERELPKEYARFLSYDGSEKQEFTEGR